MSKNTLFVQRHTAIRKLAEANGWSAHLQHLGDAQRIVAKRDENMVSIWLSKIGAVLDVYVQVPTDHVNAQGHRGYRYTEGRGRAYAEQALAR